MLHFVTWFFFVSFVILLRLTAYDDCTGCIFSVSFYTFFFVKLGWGYGFGSNGAFVYVFTLFFASSKLPAYFLHLGRVWQIHMISRCFGIEKDGRCTIPA